MSSLFLLESQNQEYVFWFGYNQYTGKQNLYIIINNIEIKRVTLLVK